MLMRSASTVVRRSSWPVAALCVSFLALKLVPVSAQAPKPAPAKKPADAARNAAKASDPAVDPAAAARRAQPIVTFKGGEVTLGELEDTLAQQTPFMRNRYRDPKALQDLVDRMVRFE